MRHILVIDVEDVTELIEAIVAPHGIKIYSAATLTQALSLLHGRNNPAAKIDTLLTETRILGATGQEAARKIRLFIPDIRVLYMSAYPGEGTVNKPFKVQELIETLKGPAA